MWVCNFVFRTDLSRVIDITRVGLYILDVSVASPFLFGCRVCRAEREAEGAWPVVSA